MKRQIILLLILALIFIGGISAESSRRANPQNPHKPTDKRAEQELNKKVFEGTNFPQGKLPAVAASAKTDFAFVREIGLPLLSPFPVVFIYHEYLKNNACGADAIIIGTVKSKTSHLTDDETFLYTNYELTVEDVLKQNEAAPIEVNSQLTVARTGGVIQLHGRKVLAVDKALGNLETGSRYLLFLGLVPDRGAYVANYSHGSFELRNNKLVKLTAGHLPAELNNGRDASLFINEIRVAVSESCDGEEDVTLK